MDYLKHYKNKLFQSYQSLEKVIDEPFNVHGEIFTIYNVEYSLHSAFDVLYIYIKYEGHRPIKELKLYAKEDGIWDCTIIPEKLNLTEKEWLINSSVLEAICNTITEFASSKFYFRYDKINETLKYLNSRSEEEL